MLLRTLKPLRVNNSIRFHSTDKQAPLLNRTSGIYRVPLLNADANYLVKIMENLLKQQYESRSEIAKRFLPMAQSLADHMPNSPQIRPVFFRRSIELCNEAGDKEGADRSMWLLGESLIQNEQWTDASIVFLQLFQSEFNKSTLNPTDLLKAANELSRSYTLLQQYEKINEITNKMKTLAKRLHNNELAWSALRIEAESFSSQGLHDEAKRTLMRAISLIRKTGGGDNPEICHLKQKLGAIQLASNDPRAAVRSYREALRIAEEFWKPLEGVHQDVAMSHRLMSAAHVANMNIKQAIPHKEREAKIVEELDVILNTKKIQVKQVQEELAKLKEMETKATTTTAATQPRDCHGKEERDRVQKFFIPKATDPSGHARRRDLTDRDEDDSNNEDGEAKRNAHLNRQRRQP
ncbi:hypothetical protein PROFUN_12283 [Planoprotostelium fungivorum]|uniref:Uncharacterized protein n=1 Tax=Planoprotostelium fungivorum TaxID=1890364 RepID=A0A2P6N7R6_9EUKA|nr:hypothetical protein PROFUN_12283 [Planoprotostelium fungivorum]